MALPVDSNPRPARGRRNRRDQRFASYITFGLQTSACMCVFLIIYVLVLLSLSPLLSARAPEDSHLQRGQALQPVVGNIVDKLKNIPHVPGQVIAEEVAMAVKNRILRSREQKNLTDALLIRKAAAEMEQIRLRRQKNSDRVSKGEGAGPVSNVGALPPGKTAGVVMLGMHRSGTSMLAGLMVKGLGYNAGGPLIGSSFDNEKGFFERIVSLLLLSFCGGRRPAWF